MSISPPSNVKLSPGEPARVLAYGVDTLYLFFQVRWTIPTILEQLATLKTQARLDMKPLPVRAKPFQDQAVGVFNMHPFGAKGYEWLLESRELAIKIGNWPEPISRPSIIVEVRSQALWQHGADSVVERARSLIEGAGGDIQSDGVSRIDLCVDVLLPEQDWGFDLRRHFVTRATKISTYEDRRRLTGFSIGRGSFSARLYDKIQEIETQSKKVWMYEVWGIESVCETYRVIRVEFQANRTVIKEMGFEGYEGVRNGLQNLWSYATQKWLRLVDDAKLHHTQQKPLPWWGIVQNGFGDALDAVPAVRLRQHQADEERILRQINGGLSSLVAVRRQGEKVPDGELLDYNSHLGLLADAARRHPMDDEAFTQKVKQKSARAISHDPGFKKAPSYRGPGGISWSHQRRRQSSR